MKEESEKAGLKLNIQKTKITSTGSISSWHIEGGKVETVRDFIFLGSKITADGDCSHEIKTIAPWKKSYDKPRQCIKKQKHHFADKGSYSQSYSFSISHVQMWELDHKEGWGPKNWCFQTVVLEKTLESPLDCKEITSHQSILKEVNPEYSLEGLMLKAESPVLWLPDANNWLIGKDSDSVKDWRQEEKGTTEDKMIRWHYRPDGHEFE